MAQCIEPWNLSPLVLSRSSKLFEKRKMLAAFFDSVLLCTLYSISASGCVHIYVNGHFFDIIGKYVRKTSSF